MLSVTCNVNGMEIQLLTCNFLYILFSLFTTAWAQESPLCSDPTCSEPIALGLTLTPYSNDKLSFNKNEEVQIFIRDFGSKKELLGVKIRNGFGFVNKFLIKETKVLKKNLIPASNFSWLLAQGQPPAVTSTQTPNLNTPGPNEVDDQVLALPRHDEFHSHFHMHPSGQANPHLGNIPSEHTSLHRSNYDYTTGSHAENVNHQHTPPNVYNHFQSIPTTINENLNNRESLNQPLISPEYSQNIHNDGQPQNFHLQPSVSNPSFHSSHVTNGNPQEQNAQGLLATTFQVDSNQNSHNMYHFSSSPTFNHPQDHREQFQVPNSDPNSMAMHSSTPVANNLQGHAEQFQPANSHQSMHQANQIPNVLQPSHEGYHTDRNSYMQGHGYDSSEQNNIQSSDLPNAFRFQASSNYDYEGNQYSFHSLLDASDYEYFPHDGQEFNLPNHDQFLDTIDLLKSVGFKDVDEMTRIYMNERQKFLMSSQETVPDIESSGIESPFFSSHNLDGPQKGTTQPSTSTEFKLAEFQNTDSTSEDISSSTTNPIYDNTKNHAINEEKEKPLTSNSGDQNINNVKQPANPIVESQEKERKRPDDSLQRSQEERLSVSTPEGMIAGTPTESLTTNQESYDNKKSLHHNSKVQENIPQSSIPPSATVQRNQDEKLSVSTPEGMIPGTPRKSLTTNQESYDNKKATSMHQNNKVRENIPRNIILSSTSIDHASSNVLNEATVKRSLDDLQPSITTHNPSVTSNSTTHVSNSSTSNLPTQNGQSSNDTKNTLDITNEFKTNAVNESNSNPDSIQANDNFQNDPLSFQSNQSINNTATNDDTRITSNDNIKINNTDKSTTVLDNRSGDMLDNLENKEVFGEENDLPFTTSILNNSSHLEVDDLVPTLSELKSDFAADTNSSDYSEKLDIIDQYQSRHLKQEQDSVSESVTEPELNENVTDASVDLYTNIQNSLQAIRGFINIIISWVPEPLHSTLTDLEEKGISPRVPVFTILSAIPCVIIIVVTVYIKERSKERKLTAQLTVVEAKLYHVASEKNILEEKLENAESQISSHVATLEDERNEFKKMKAEIEYLKDDLQKANDVAEEKSKVIHLLQEREQEYKELVNDHEKTYLELLKNKEDVDKQLSDQESEINELSQDLIEKEKRIDHLVKDNLEYVKSNEDYSSKLVQMQQNCNQLLKEAEAWNEKVNELNCKLNEEVSMKEEFQDSLKSKEEEIEYLNNLVQTFKAFEEIEESTENNFESKDEKLQFLMQSSKTQIHLKKQEDMNQTLTEKLTEEKNKSLDLEVELLEAKSEVDKLKINYNQALQDRTEAQTKLDVLTNYFKDKEIQLQKQLGAQEAVRQRNEKDASSAERRICLIDQENASYKSQVAKMKQEIEETERNLKSQIATQEEKAHENWIAARTAERKLEDMKQEVTQLRQRLILIEREQENITNSAHEEVLQNAPKRLNEDSPPQGSSNSMDPRHPMFPVPRPIPSHMLLPSDRPLPIFPPPPPFLPPLEPPHFRPQPWHMPPSDIDFRMTPPDFGRGRASTPPRGRINDGEMGPRQSSPIGGDLRDSRNSTPPHMLPDFHDLPPRPLGYPPFGPPRYPMPPPFRPPPRHSRPADLQQSDNSSRRLEMSPLSYDSWQQNSRV